MTDLVLERKDQPNETPVLGGGLVMMTPPIDEGYWLFRVRLSEKQAIVGFPKFGTIGIGFAQEEDWNTNLPYTCDTAEIYHHIDHNKGDGSITDADCLEAIRLVQEAAAEFKRAELVKDMKRADDPADFVMDWVKHTVEYSGWSPARKVAKIAEYLAAYHIATGGAS